VLGFKKEHSPGAGAKILGWCLGRLSMCALDLGWGFRVAFGFVV
jgi:hypothetical protein